jgi:hypothetical protein
METSYYYFNPLTEPLNRSIIGQYQAVFWFDDGIAAANWLPEDVNQVRWYLDHNTNLMLGGWRTAFEFAGLSGNREVFDGNFLHDYAGVTRIREITQIDLQGAFGENGLPDLHVDSAKLHPAWGGLLGWNGTLEADSTGEIMYRYDSRSGANEGRIIGIRRANGNSKFAFVSLPLYYMHTTEARQALETIAGWFGVGPCRCDHIGDCAADGQIDAADIVYLVSYALQMTGPPPPSDPECPVINRGDWDCNGQVDLSDIVRMVNYVFHYPAPGPCDPCAQ